MSPVLYKLSPYQFTHEHMHNLLHGEMIDAEVIDFYLKLLLEKHQVIFVYHVIHTLIFS